MLADDLCVHARGGDVGASADLPSQARGVQRGAGGEDPLRRQAAGLLGEHGENVAGVGDDHVDRLRRDGDQVLHERAHDAGVRGGQLEAGLAGLLLRPGRDDHDVGPGGDGDVAATTDLRRPDELRAVGQIQDLRAGLLLSEVVQGDVAGHAADHRGMRDARSDGSGSHDGQRAHCAPAPTIRTRVKR